MLEQSGHLYIGGEITEQSASSFIKALHRTCMASGESSIKIWINSPGGNVSDAIAMYDQIRIMRAMTDKYFFTIGQGEVCSAATAILQAGDRRVMLKGTMFMLHEMSYGNEGTVSQHIDTMEGAKRQFAIYLKILAERVKDKKKLKELFNRKETYFTAGQCKRLRLVDEVW